MRTKQNVLDGFFSIAFENCLRGGFCRFFQFFPIARRFHRILNRNPPIRNARQRVGNNLARPISDAVQLRQFSFDFFEFGKKGFAFRFKPCAFRFQCHALLLIERRRKPQRLHELFAQPYCFLQSAQFVAVFGFELFSLAIPVNAFVFLLNWLQFSDGLNRAKQRVDIADSTFLCRGFRLDFGKCLFGFVDVPSELTDRVKLVIREEGNRLISSSTRIRSISFRRRNTRRKPCRIDLFRG